MQRNSTAAAEADAYRPELIADDEPRYLPVKNRLKFAARNSRVEDGPSIAARWFSASPGLPESPRPFMRRSFCFIPRRCFY